MPPVSGIAHKAPSLKKRILVVEDDKALSRALFDNLTYEGFDVLCAGDGASAVQLAGEHHPDLILLDLTLPDADGFDLFGALRGRGRSAVIFLTARGQKLDKLKGLGLGADDYVTKPFDLEELLARVRAVLRRSGSMNGLAFGRVTVDLKRHLALRSGRPLRLSRREIEIIRYLAERHDRVVHRDELLREVWGYPDAPITRLVDNAIARLRKKIEDDAHRPRFLHTVHGDGYCLTVEDRGSSPPGS